MASKRIKDLTNTAAESDLVSGNYFALDGSAGTKKLNSTTLLTKTAQNALGSIHSLSGTATDFASDDYIGIDGATNGSRKMTEASLLEKTAQNAIGGNVAQTFDESGNTNYSAGTPITRNGKTFVFKVDHSGAWSSSDVEAVDLQKIFLLRKDFNEKYVCKDGFIVDKLNGYYSTPNAEGVSTFTASRDWLSVKIKVSKLTKYNVFGENGYISVSPKLIFVDSNNKFFVASDLVSSIVDNSFSFIVNDAEYAIIQFHTTKYESTIYRIEKNLEISPVLLGNNFNLVTSFNVGDWQSSGGSVVAGTDQRYIRAKVTLKPFTTYSFNFYKSGVNPRVALCVKDSTTIITTFATSGEVSTQAYEMDLYICCRIFQGTDFDSLNSLFVVEKSRQDDFKPLCDWVNTSSNMIAGWYRTNLVLADGENDIVNTWNQIYFAHSTPIPVTAGQWEFKGQGIGVTNMFVMKSDALGNPSRDFYVNGLGLGNNTPFKKVFNIPAGVDYVIVQGVCCNGKANSNFYLRRLSESLESGSVFNPVTYGSVVVHTKDVRTVVDGVGVVDDNGNTDEDRYVVMYPTKPVTGKRKIVVMFHGAGEPVNASSWRGLEVPMANFFAAMGYVVCASNGMPSAFATANELPYYRPVGNYMWIESACKMVEKVCREYDCDPNEIYVYGESQGGMGALNFIEGGNIPVKACVLDSPAISMLYSQLNISGAATSLKFFYDFENAQEYTPEKVYGLDPFTRNCDKVEIKEDYTLTSGRYLDATEMAKCVSKRVTKCPVKFFLGTADTTTPAYPSQLVYKQLKNAGQLVACNVYQGIGHCVDQNAPVIGTFSYRDVTFNVTQPIVDMANWWARFGGYDELPEIT